MSDYIVSNQIECLECGDKPFSMHRHDMTPCKCGDVAVDGGQDYLRRLIRDGGAYTELSITISMEDMQFIHEEAQRATASNRNALGVSLAVTRALRDRGLLKGFIPEEKDDA